MAMDTLPPPEATPESMRLDALATAAAADETLSADDVLWLIDQLRDAHRVADYWQTRAHRRLMSL